MALPVYVIHYRAPEWCAATVESLSRSAIDVDVKVIDNSGGLCLQVPIIERRENLGFAGAANLAIADSAPAPFVLITSHDLCVEPETVGMLVDRMTGDSSLGIIGPAVGGAGEVIGSEDGIEYRTWVSGTCLLLRRSCIEEIGAFDEDYGSYVEDADLGLRATDAGWRVGRLLGARAAHRGSAIGSGGSSLEIEANTLLLAFKRKGSVGFLVGAAGLSTKLVRSSVLAAVPGGVGEAHRRRARYQALGLARGIKRVRRVASRDAPAPTSHRLVGRIRKGTRRTRVRG